MAGHLELAELESPAVVQPINYLPGNASVMRFNIRP